MAPGGWLPRTTNHQAPSANHQPRTMSSSRKSKFPLAELIKSLAPITWMGRLMLAGVAVWFIDWVFIEGETLFGSRSLKTVVDVASALALIPLAYFLIVGARWVAGNLLWGGREW